VRAAYSTRGIETEREETPTRHRPVKPADRSQPHLQPPLGVVAKHQVHGRLCEGWLPEGGPGGGVVFRLGLFKPRPPV